MLTPNVKTMFDVKIHGQSLIVQKKICCSGDIFIYVPFVGTTKGYVTSHPVGDGSKPWYLVNPKIAGKWMFIPLKMYL